MRTRPLARLALPLLATGVLIAPLGVSTAVGSNDNGGPSGSRGARGPVTSDQVTLITGDELDIHTFADGRRSVSIEPAEREDGESPEFHQMEIDGDTYVIPGDARQLISSGVLDQRLFNLAELTESDVGDTGSELPLIVTYADRFRRQATARLAGAQEVTALPSIDGAALSVEGDDAAAFWADVTETRPSGKRQTMQQPIEKIWLDDVVEVALEDSVPQIRAPQAWDAGYDGSGSTVAILDTGVDDTHPDLAGSVVAAEGFTNEGTADDGHGHGTHVAATVAGSGAGSGGLRRGVAPGADLLNGKVLNDGGNGQTSWIIAGMEWAVGEGADVVNMSLGGSPTDGTDPLSQAVDRLTESSDTLFVIASGNDGRDRYVSTPGAATKALTVGAVDDSDELAYFSNRGPRRGDYIIKPDITAPGVGIIAARAGDTSMGQPVDDLYTEASGTSMATPHVAGVAAMLAGAYPDRSAQQLKEVLVASAVPSPDHSVYEQGGGRVDAERAVASPVVASPAPLNLGYFTWPYDDAQPVTESVTFTNSSDTGHTLNLDIAMRTEDGDAAPDGMVTLSETVLTVPAGGSAQVDVTVDPRLGDFALYGGYLTATEADSGDTLVSVPAGFYKEDERVTLKIEGVARDGEPAALNSFVDVTNVDDIEDFNSMSTEFIDGTASLRVPPGTYNVMGGLHTYDMSGEEPESTGFALVGNPEVDVTEDTSLVLDARRAHPISVDVRTHDVGYPKDGAPNATVAYMRRDLQDVPASHSVSSPDLPYFAATTEPVSDGEFEFSTRHILTAPGEGFDSPYLFDAEYVERDAIPRDLSYVVDDAALEQQFAHVDNDFHANAAEAPYAEFRHHWRPYQRGSIAFARHFSAPLERADYVSATDSTWGHDVLQAEEPNGATVGRMFGPNAVYEPGDRLAPTWFRSPFHPTFRDGVVDGQAELPSVRDGDVLDLLVYSLSDSEVGHSSLAFYYPGFETDFRLYQDGELAASASRARGDFDVAPGPHEFRLELDTTSTSEYDWAQRSTSTRTAWTVQSSGTAPDGDPEVLPLLHVDYDVPLDLRNRLTKAGASWLDLHVRHQKGADAGEIESLRAWFSTDDGDTWEESRIVQDRGDGDFRVLFVDASRAGDEVSIRVDARDGDGNRIEQEVIRAFGTR